MRARISRLSERLTHASSAAAGRTIESFRVSRQRRKLAYGLPLIDTGTHVRIVRGRASTLSRNRSVVAGFSLPRMARTQGQARKVLDGSPCLGILLRQTRGYV